MAYVTIAQLTNRLGSDRYISLTDRNRTGSPDDVAAAAALDGASSTADSYLAAFLPISPVPEALVEAIIAIATYALAGNAATEDERRRYEDALRWLRDVQASRAALGTPEGALAGGGSPHVEGPAAQFSADQTRRIL
jgi:phage gp36-like protein